MNSLSRRQFAAIAIVATTAAACTTAAPAAAAPRRSAPEGSRNIVIEVVDRQKVGRAKTTRLVVSLADGHGTELTLRAGSARYRVAVRHVNDGTSTFRIDVERHEPGSLSENDFEVEAVTKVIRGKKSVLARVHRPNGIQTLVEASIG